MKINLNPVPALRAIYNKCMTQPEYNSRLVYLATFVLCSALMIWHTFTYLVLKRADPQYPTVMLYLLGGHAGNGLSRFLTKIGGQKDDTSDPAPASDSDSKQ